MRLATIRSTLLSLIGSLGAVLLVVVALQLANLRTLEQQANSQFDANLARNQVARGALALARERDAYYLALATGTPVRPETAMETDRSFAAFRIAADQANLGDGTATDGISVALEDRLPGMRQAASGALRLPLGSQARQNLALRWFEDASQAVADLRILRLRLLSQSDSISLGLFGLYSLRTHTLNLLDELMKNAAVVEVDVAVQTLPELQGGLALVRPDVSRVTEAASEVAMSVAPFEEFLRALGNEGRGPGINSFDSVAYAASGQRLRDALQAGEGVAEALADWRRVSGAAILQLDELQAATFGLTQDRLGALAAEARRSAIFWAVLLFSALGIVIVAVRVVLVSVVGPLERMRAAMLQLAEDNLSVELPKPSKLKEIGAMDDALRVFKANATRRRVLQKERLRLHGRLEETYGHLKTDLEAAAVIQASLLPQQAQIAGISLSSYFRPSHFLAGDTFDVLQEPDGRVIVFQIDVAGHGAAAALVSVASKYTVAQAILQRLPGTGLAELTRDINREWPSDLPYFTLILAEIDPATGHGTLVQAGHPSPLLLRSTGEVIVLGDGGLPIGVLPHATFVAIPFAFGPKDRLLIATDGVHEMSNREGELFSEERVQDLLRTCANRSTEQILTQLDTSLRTWRGDDTLDDDVTIVVLEGKRANEYQ